MGASEFTDIVIGTDMNTAFTEAVHEARYMNGHGGYTGTIAEKHGYRAFTLPPLPEGVSVYDITHLSPYDDEPTFWNGGKRTPCPPDLFARLKPMLEVADDKWGDAVGIDITDTPEGEKALERHLSGRPLRILPNGGTEPLGPDPVGLRVFLFFGWASS